MIMIRFYSAIHYSLTIPLACFTNPSTTDCLSASPHYRLWLFLFLFTFARGFCFSFITSLVLILMSHGRLIKPATRYSSAVDRTFNTRIS